MKLSDVDLKGRKSADVRERPTSLDINGTNAQENGSLVDKEIVVENKVDLDIGSSLPLYKGDINVGKEMGENSITKEALI